MKVTIHSIRGHVRIDDMPDDNVATMLDEYRDPDTQVLTVTLDGAGVTHILRGNIIRIDLGD